MKPADSTGSRPFLIAITGGICSGKSTVSDWFAKRGFPVFFADKIGHQILEDSEILNRLLHPRIRLEMQKIIDSFLSKTGFLIFEIPLLFENGLEEAFDLTINVYADERTQKDRLKKRDGLSDAEAEKRISAQMSADKKKKKADVNIVNNGSIESLYLQLENLLNTFNSLKYKKIKTLTEI
ncbi:MAG: dephospho-CoA kinase [Candidatus Cloacimonas sp. 4484_275]|nr:MAG: dephospho-CoA kinase [Candidatus Cloacimonas sp. 4484_275]